MIIRSDEVQCLIISVRRSPQAGNKSIPRLAHYRILTLDYTFLVSRLMTQELTHENLVKHEVFSSLANYKVALLEIW